MNIRANPKALFRLRQACEKVKKILSANSVTLLNVESLLDDKDVSAQVQKADYSEWVKPLFDRLVAPVTRALKAAGMEASEIDFVELVGGSTRIPAVKEFLNEYFKGPNGEQKISTTLNQDEAVARGCALQCAMISPVFKVRDFAVQDWNTFPVSLHWDPSIVPPSKSGEIPDTTIEVFATGNSAPSAKVLTFYRAMSDDELAKHNGAVSFDIDALYGVGPEALPFVENNYIGKFSVRGIRKLASDTTEGPLKAVIKLKARLDGSNIISLDSAQQIEEVLVPEEEKKEEKKDEKKDDGKSEQKGAEAMETDEAPPAQPKMKKVTRKHDLTIISATSALSQELLGEWRSLELSMEAGDRLVVDTAERRNQLEEYVYHVRGQLEMAWSDFVTDADREALNAELNEMEDWLYGDGEDATKSVYIEKHDLLKKKGDPIAARFRDAEDRPRAEKLFREYCNSVAISLSSDDDRYAHIPSTDIDKVRDEVTKKLGWLNDTIAALHESPKHVNPTVTVAGINREREALVAFVTPILNKPKPAPPKKEETPAPEPSAAAADQKPAAAEAGEGAAAPEPNADATKEAPSMDVD
ncbi:adenyl-nucleotide exchange factor sse1 [Cladochytrium tenue]|nr:adenyl-nucleotide exchange factor sse1 [Cladochytrium tenue]